MKGADQPADQLRLWAETRLGSRIRLRPLPADGGHRRYFRLEGRSLLALLGPNQAENLAWLRIGRHLWFKGLPLPRIQDYDLDNGFFLLDDLGDLHLSDSTEPGRYYPLAVELLARLHREGLEGFNPDWCYQTRTYAAAMIAAQEIGYFLDSVWVAYLKQPAWPRGAKTEALALARLAAPRPGERVLMHRDFQGRNLMIQGGRLFCLDWQGARPGAAAYDLASLLNETPHGPLTDRFKDELIERYCQARGAGAWRRSFRRDLAVLSPIRLMQALAAYAKLTLAGKNKFAALMPPAAALLAKYVRQPALAGFPILRETALEAARRLETES